MARLLAVPTDVARRELLAVAPAGLVVVAWIGLIHRAGGYFMLDWAPVALVLVALLVGIVVRGGRALPPPGAARRGLLVFAGIVAWNALSVAWSDAPATAWEESDQLLLYLLMAWVLVLVPWTGPRALWILVAWSFGVAAMCLVAYLDALTASDLGAQFPEFRWAGPLGYANATAALAAIALPGPLLLAARRGTGIAVQAGAMATAAFLAEFALLPQTRAALLGMPLIALVLLAATPERARLLVRLCLLAVAGIAVFGPLLDLDAAAQAHGPVRPAFDAAARAILLSIVGVALATVAVAAAERSVRLAPSVARMLRLGAACVAAVAVLVGVAAGVASADRIGDAAQTVWQDVRGGAPVRRVDGPRLLSVAPYQRSDYWRVAVDAVRSAPVGGLAAGGFEQRYDELRGFAKHSRYAHMIWLRVAAENGIVGVLLLVALLAVTVPALVLGARRGPPDGRRVIALALALSAYMALGASLDWLEEFPVLAGPVLGAGAIALALSARPAARRAPGRHARLLAPATVALALVAVLAVALPWLSLGSQREARRLAASDPAAARRALDRAADLDPLDPRPANLSGFIALQAGRPAQARAAFQEGLRIEDGWLGHFELALLDAAQGRTAQARRSLAVARRLDRDEPIITTVREMLDRGEAVDPVAVNRQAQQEPLYTERPAT